ncbi:MAG: YtxH domain-containing protein [Elusimicrobia bacterium]|nr:YtxH domain-containing protein [Elusimicrobiota bacterium]
MADNNTGENIMAFVIGGLVGAAAGILLAPRRGCETRKALTDWLEEKRERTEAFAREERDTLLHKKEQVEAAWEAGKKAYKDAA